MIKTVIKTGMGNVMVFDENGEQMPEYQGKHEDMKECILRNAPPEALFFDELIIPPILREEW